MRSLWLLLLAVGVLLIAPGAAARSVSGPDPAPSRADDAAGPRLAKKDKRERGKKGKKAKKGKKGKKGKKDDEDEKAEEAKKEEEAKKAEEEAAAKKAEEEAAAKKAAEAAKPKVPMVPLAQENVHHSMRMAQIAKIEAIAKEKGNDTLLEKAKKLKELEKTRHQKRMTKKDDMAEKKAPEKADDKADDKAAEAKADDAEKEE